MSNQIVPQFDQKAILEAMMNPLGSLNLSPTETKMLFFRHLGAEYAQSAKRGRVPYANQLVKAGTAFGGLGGGTDPLMMILLMGMFKDKKDLKDPNDITPEPEVKADVGDVLNKVLDRLDAIEAKVGAGA